MERKKKFIKLISDKKEIEVTCFYDDYLKIDFTKKPFKLLRNTKATLLNCGSFQCDNLETLISSLNEFFKTNFKPSEQLDDEWFLVTEQIIN